MNKVMLAIEQLEKQIKSTVNTTSINTCRLAIEALEKQIPKKVIFKASKYIPYEKYSCCSNCDYPLGIDAEPDYCYDCGQKLDWSGGE